MRHLDLLTLASLAALAVVACGTAPDDGDVSASSTQDLVTCPPGQVPECSFDSGRKTCQCVASTAPPTCNFVVPTPPTENTSEHWFIESWAVAPTNGQCPDIPAADGTWRNLDSSYLQNVPPPYCFNGVPCESADPNTVRSCSIVFGSQPCCTYVWWPAGFVLEQSPSNACDAPVESVCSSELNVRGALCTHSGQTFTALENEGCAGGTCPQPGGSGCTGACTQIN